MQNANINFYMFPFFLILTRALEHAVFCGTITEPGLPVHKKELKSLYFNLVYVFLFSAKTRIYKQNKHTYTQSGAENSLFQFCLTITEPRFLLSISRK